MDIFSIIFIAVGLAMDCFAVSISKGICTKKFFLSYAVRMAFLFGFFQAAMTAIGYGISSYFAEEIMSVDHWIAFVLLCFIGVKMIVESLEKKKEDEKKECKEDISKHFKWKALISLSIATSIDALATGVVFAPYPQYIWLAVLLIGICSFVFSIVGVILGVYAGKRFKFNVEMAGGIILIAIGSKILIEHLFFP